ncbi:ATP-binding cassette domain-containing protein [Vibrio sp. SCSIO 43136]|uniref:ABC-F family ATP-binding cassette domain-containing protein n=1 Tax=Vibrio sp. SCSIO 43136 TaxID=2819101 RepID=UPI002075BDB0|nr:ATP-binding cassette domain-containing protein [Vibrio sp. SCSIO 43136]USD64037.1 ABC-F family ATP-binding cassette domain-containing protein [Vibrio sp. SCSIO 43136]
MSTLLSAQSIHFHTTSAPLFEGISFTLKQGDRIGLVGHNGCGKSTLLQILCGNLEPRSGDISIANHCLLQQVEQHLPMELEPLSMLQAVVAKLPEDEQEQQQWRAEMILSDMGFAPQDWHLTAGTLSGGQHTRLLLARALILQPDLLLLDEPSNHLDLPTLLWLEQFLLSWRGSFVLVSHDRRLLDKVTNCTWILRDQSLSYFQLPCTSALQELEKVDEAALQRNLVEQKEIDRIEKSAKRLAIWGRVYDNEDLSRKAKNMERRIERLKDSQTQVTSGTPWQLTLRGEALKANRLLSLDGLIVKPAPDAPQLFEVNEKQIKSGDRIAILGGNGCGKSSMLRMLWQQYQLEQFDSAAQFHPRCRMGFYDQSLKQLEDDHSLMDALRVFTNLPEERRKMALISAGFEFSRHTQKVASLSGGERSRLLMLGLSMANYHLVMLDEPTNHLDLDGKDELADTLQQFEGGALLVTHDRELIEKSCNRFWLVQNGALSEWHDIEKLYQHLDSGIESAFELTAQVSGNLSRGTLQNSSFDQPCEEQLLETLVCLESLLEEDKRRKPKHQKPKLQKQWREEIERISAQLSLD